MKVYKGYLIALKRNVSTVILYCTIFFGVAVSMVYLSNRGENTGAYSQERLAIGIVDRDNSLWSQALEKYLEQYHDVTVMEDDMDELAEAVYGRRIRYAVIIPENFYEECIQGGGKVESVTESGSQWEYYVNSRVDNFINSARVYLAGGYTQEEAAENVLDTADIQAQVELESSREDLGIYNVFRFMPYLYFSILCFVLGLIQKEYQNIDIRRRLEASSMTLKNKNIQSLLAFLTVGIFSWILCEGIGIATCFSEFWSSPNKWLILLNGFTIMLGALAAAFFVGSMARTDAAVNGMANVLSLGFCFLGGIFVPLELLTGVVRRIGQFFPTYWYAQNISILSFNETLTDSLKTTLIQGMGIQILFALACVAVALTVGKARRQEE